MSESRIYPHDPIEEMAAGLLQTVFWTSSRVPLAAAATEAGSVLNCSLFQFQSTMVTRSQAGVNMAVTQATTVAILVTVSKAIRQPPLRKAFLSID